MAQDFTSPFDTSGQIDPEIIANPYPSYHQMRTRDPVHWNAETPCWDLTRYADVESVYRDRRMSSDRMSMFAARIPEPEISSGRHVFYNPGSASPAAGVDDGNLIFDDQKHAGAPRPGLGED